MLACSFLKCILHYNRRVSWNFIKSAPRGSKVQNIIGQPPLKGGQIWMDSLSQRLYPNIIVNEIRKE